MADCCCCRVSAQQAPHETTLSAATTKFSDVPVPPTKIWFLSFTRREFWTPETRSTVSHFLSHLTRTRDLWGSGTWQTHKQQGRACNTTQTSWCKGPSSDPAELILLNACSVTYGRLDISTVHLYSRKIKHRFTFVHATKLTAKKHTIWLNLPYNFNCNSLSETIWITDVTSMQPQCIQSYFHHTREREDRHPTTRTSESVAGSQQRQRKRLAMDSPATSAWSSSSRFRTQRRKQLVPCSEERAGLALVIPCSERTDWSYSSGNEWNSIRCELRAEWDKTYNPQDLKHSSVFINSLSSLFPSKSV